MDLFYADLHCDTIYESKIQKEQLKNNSLHISLDKMGAFKNCIQVFAAWTSDKLNGSERYDNFIEIYDNFMHELNVNSEAITLCRNSNDIKNAINSGKIAAILGIEGAGALCGNIANVKIFYDMGVRIITLTWNGENELGLGVPLNGPLKSFGLEVVKKMNELNMIIDVSHLSEKGFWDLCSATESAFVASHSNSKSVCSHSRNLTDEQFREIVRRSGLVGINLCPDFLNDDHSIDGKTGIYHVLKHIEHFLELGGEKTICFGADFDGVNELPYGICGINDMSKIPELLLSHNIKEEIVYNIMYGNVYNYLCSNL